MKRFIGVVVALTLAGCPGPEPEPMDMTPVRDMRADMADGGGGAGNIGDPCTDNMQCTEGATPLCWKNYLLNRNSYLPTHGGLCTSSCNVDADCGANGSCEDFGGMLGKWCFKKCMAPTDCRSNGYACFLFSPNTVCFPNDNLNCDPTMGDGTCADFFNVTGGCVRGAMGTGKQGSCEALCQIGTGTCPPDRDGNKQICLINDETRTLEGMMTGDKFKGPLCFSGVMTPIANGLECLYTPTGSTMAGHYIDVCNDGYECYLKGMGTGGGFDQNGDNLCRQLCYLNGSPVSLPDGGMPLPDGGMPMTGACATGTCQDVWGLANTFGIGLCK